MKKTDISTRKSRNSSCLKILTTFFYLVCISITPDISQAAEMKPYATSRQNLPEKNLSPQPDKKQDKNEPRVSLETIRQINSNLSSSLYEVSLSLQGEQINCSRGDNLRTEAFSENFHNTQIPPAGWTLYNNGQTTWTSSTDSYSGSHAAYHNFNFNWSQTPAVSWLVSPAINLTNENAEYVLSFHEKNQYMSHYGYSGVRISSGSGNPNHHEYVELYESGTAASNYTQTAIDISSYAGETIYIAFVYSGFYAHRWWVDDIRIQSSDINPVADFPWLECFEESSATKDKWFAFNQNGDTFNWTHIDNASRAHGGSGFMSSASFINNLGPLTPENWMVSPLLDLSQAQGDKTLILQWYASAMDQHFPNDQYSVYLSTGGRNPEDFTELLFSEAVQAQGGENNNYWHRSVDITAFENEQQAYIAFRHHDCTDFYMVNIDDVSVYRGVMHPRNFSAQTYSYARIDLSWQKNANQNHVLIAYSTDRNIGEPIAGISYNTGDQIDNGTVIYQGPAEAFSLTGLAPLQQYHFKIWSVDHELDYSGGTWAKAHTHAALPFTENFDINSESRPFWTQSLTHNIAYWFYESGASTGNVSSAYSGELNAAFTLTEPRGNPTAANPNSTMLISPVIYLADYDQAVLTFYHAQQRHNSTRDNNRLKVLYRTHPGEDWIELEHYQAHVNNWRKREIILPNLSATYQIAFEAIETHINNHNVVLDEIRIAAPGLWIGTIDNNWHNPRNWDINEVPDQQKDYVVVIPPEAPQQPQISQQDAFVAKMVIQDGASLTLTNNAILHIHDGFMVHGQLNAGNNDERIIFSEHSEIGVFSENASFNHLEMNGEYVKLLTDIVIRKDFTLQAGIWDTNNKDMYVGRNWNIMNGTFEAYRGHVIFNGEADHVIGGAQPAVFNHIRIDSGNLLSGSAGFSVKGNWINNGGNFTFTQGTVSIESESQVEIKAGSNSFFHNLELNSGWVTLGAPLVVRNNLILNTNIHTLEHYVRIGREDHPGHITHQSGRIIGEIHYWIDSKITSDHLISLPLGTETHNRWVEMNYTETPAPGYLQARFTEEIPFGENYYANLPVNCGDQQINNLSQEGVWMIRPLDNTLTGGTYNIRFNTHGLQGIMFAEGLRMVKRSEGSDHWTIPGIHAGVETIDESQSAYWVKRNNISTFSYYALGGDLMQNPMPVDLLSFQAKVNDTEIALSWSTASEINNDYFIIEKASTPGLWETIAMINGQGTTSQTHHYQVTDPQPHQGISYYRLVQYDFDGTKTAYDPVAVQFATAHGQLTLHNVSFSGNQLWISYSSPCPHISYEVINMEGKPIFSSSWAVHDQHHNVSESLPLSSGLYILRLSNSHQVVSEKFMAIGR